MKERILKNIAEIQVSGKSTIELYNEISSAVMREISFTAHATDKKSAYYLSIEFLIGRMFYNNLLELDFLHATEEILKAKGADIFYLKRSRTLLSETADLVDWRLVSSILRQA